MVPPVQPSASREPRWPAALAMVAMLALVLRLPAYVRLFPGWFPYVAVAAVLAPMALVAATNGSPLWVRVERALVLGVAAIIGLFDVVTLTVVIRAMLNPTDAVSGLALLASAVNLWVTTIVVASLVYWQLDRGGPDRRAHGTAGEPDWRFPRDDQADGAQPWVPAYADYLFLAFTTATAFSPTDTVPLTARAKMMMLVQAFLSLVTMVIVAARAVGELGP